jgi:hypothetical protein
MNTNGGKLRLEMDELKVESFELDAARTRRGTVHGQLTAYYEFCYPEDTWQASCTCEPTCNDQTCYNCSAACASAQCASGRPRCATATDPLCCQLQSSPLSNCSVC